MKRIFITGATGMIGASLIKQMLSDGKQVTAVIRPNSNKKNNLKNVGDVKIIECDIQNLLSLKSEFSEKYDAFYHFAWDGTYGESRNDIDLQEKNISCTLDAVELAHALGCDVFIGAGSQAEFGHVEGIISDKLPKNPQSGYGAAKLSACYLSRIKCSKLNIRHCWGRIVSTYGPYDNEYTLVMSSIIGMLDGKRMTFTKGDQIWDYIYGEECSKAFYLIGLYGRHGKAYTIGSGKTFKLSECIEIIRDCIDPKLEIGIGERDYYSDQVMHLCADISELQEDTGFIPKVQFKEGIMETIKWVKNISKEES